MEVLKSGDAPSLLSNIEVMNLLKERASKQKSLDGTKLKSEGKKEIKQGPFQNRDLIESSVLSYLESSPCGRTSAQLGDMPKLIERLQRDPNQDGYGLTNTEILQVLNHLPSSLVELHLLIEDLENRPGFVGEEKQEEFLKLIFEYSGKEIRSGGGEEAMET